MTAARLLDTLTTSPPSPLDDVIKDFPGSGLRPLALSSSTTDHLLYFKDFKASIAL